MLRFPIAVSATVLMLSCAACGGNDSPTATPSRSPIISVSTPTVSVPPPHPSATVPAYLASYTTAQRQAYKLAVVAYGAFASRNAMLLAKGTTSPAGLAFYRHFSTDWVAAWANLGQLANNHIRVTGPSTATHVRPVSIRLDNAQATVVVLRRCVDESRLTVTQNGTTLDQPNLKHPHVYRVRLEMRHGESWWRSGAAAQGSTC